jgi:hypothetical protein
LVDFSVFEYCYCDASNYKVWGNILLDGFASDTDHDALVNHFDAGEFFIAEQVGIPPLYAGLWELSGGPSVDDHVWHTSTELRAATADDIKVQVFGTVEDFISKIKGIKTWNQQLSPHWGL